MTLRAIWAAAALCVAGMAQAETTVRPVIGASFTAGGEKLARVSFTDGSHQDVRSGGLVHLFGGFEVQMDSLPLTVQANIGYHVDNSAAKNGEVRFQRWPIEVLGFFQGGDGWRFGGGVRKANGVKLTSSGASYIGNYDMSAKAGWVLQAEHVWPKGLSAFVRVVSEKYEVQGAEVQGRHVGVGTSYRF
ncbi:hypothetical protein [Inhella gelatinilytica]|uniref:Outer membrane protein beta-barrel domain-containing protein n=1 Tax=Inhella gelatinilytica TaxID=2795030 RepID=A0A931ISV2_9BURK|nr:hypothetical protein [Inhella gelatinilytica]MBH9551514.1 hypothetical protein [Inhella gelatinilytica]